MSDPLPPTAAIDWHPAYRIVPTRYPSVFLFDRVADASDFDALYELEAMTNDRIRDEIGELRLVPPEDRLFGPGSGPIMAAFTHLNPAGSRFSDGRWGVFYAAHDRSTAIAETRYHHARFLAATRQPAMHLPMRLYRVTIAATLHDLRGDTPALRAVHDPLDYRAGQAMAASLRQAGSAGVVYHSVREAGGQNVGLFKPTAARDCLHAAHLLYHWNGQAFTDVYEKTA
ncbi:MAG: RES family NAD+ phosphorylase [Burkholderiaceae bacterium]